MLNYEVRIGNTVYTSSLDNAVVTVVNGSPALGTPDTFSIFGRLEGATLSSPIDFYFDPRVELTLEDSSGAIFDDDTLPSTQLLLNQFSSARLLVKFTSQQFSSQTAIIGTNMLAVSAPAILGDVNLDDVIDFSDIPAFISVLQSGGFRVEADVDQNGEVNFADIPAFISILIRQ